MISEINALMKPFVEDIEVFVDLSLTLSFSKTATRLRLDRTLASKRIQRLEQMLKIKLFERTTRAVRLTTEGKKLLLISKDILGGLEALGDHFNETKTPQGLVRISAPVTVSQSILTYALPRIQKKYPEIQIELMATDRMLNFIEEGLDLTIRSTVPKDSSFIGRLLVKNELIFAASPKYLKTNGIPKKIAELKNHELLFLDFHREIFFKKNKIKLSQFEERRPVICSDGRILARLSEEGVGICIRPRWDISSSLAKGSLVEIVMDDVLNDRTSLFLLYPKTQLMPNRTRLVIDALLEYFHFIK